MKYLLFILLLASLLTIDSPVTNKLRVKLIGFISNAAHSEYSENRITDSVSEEIRSHFNSLNDAEEQFVEAYLDDPKSLLKFYRDYCEHEGFYSEMSDLNRRKICKIIDEHLEPLESEALRTKP